MSGRVLMLMIEPAPYIVGFITKVMNLSPNPVEVAFVGNSLTQPWDENFPHDKVLPRNFFKAALDLWICLKREHYSLVHLAGWSHPVIFVSLLICAVRGIPTTVESDTPLRAESTGWRRWVKRLLYPWLFRLPSLFLPGGSRQAAFFLKYGVTPDRIRVANMTVDIEAIRDYRLKNPVYRREQLRKNRGFADQQTVFLYVGRLEKYKGILDLLSAYKELLARSNGRSVALLVVGDGTCRSAVADAAPLLHGVTAAGRLTGTDLFDAYMMADVLVLPSPTDNWGLVVNEAMAFQLPVIVADTVGCVDDLVVHEVTGLVVPSSETKVLANAMLRLASSGELRTAFGAAALRRIAPWSLHNEAVRVVGAWGTVKSK